MNPCRKCSLKSLGQTANVKGASAKTTDTTLMWLQAAANNELAKYKGTYLLMLTISIFNLINFIVLHKYLLVAWQPHSNDMTLGGQQRNDKNTLFFVEFKEIMCQQMSCKAAGMQVLLHLDTAKMFY